MSARERNDIVISWLVISVAFGFAMVDGFADIEGLMISILIAMLAVGTGFVFHELAHKYVAIKYGCHAEYRAYNTWLLVALLLGVFLRVVFAAPGAVYIFGQHITARENGIISLSGPLINLILGIVLLAIALFAPLGPVLGFAFAMASAINFWLGLFNMIPVMPFDGSKVFVWNPIVWGIVSAVLFAFVFFKGAIISALLGFAA